MYAKVKISSTNFKLCSWVIEKLSELMGFSRKGMTQNVNRNLSYFYMYARHTG